MARSYNATTTAGELVKDLAHEIKGKVILATGVSPKSLGATFVESIASGQLALLILAGHDNTKLERVANAINMTYSQVQVRLLQLDLGSLATVRKSAAEIDSWDGVPHIDVLVNNTGIIGNGLRTLSGWLREPASHDSPGALPLHQFDYGQDNRLQIATRGQY